MSKPINDDRLLPLAVCDDECEMCEAHSASDEGIFATVGDDEFSLLVYSHRNARRIGEWLIKWADARRIGMGDPLTLNDYLPVIDHPEHGKAICKAAGVDLGKEDYITLFLDGVCFFGQKENLPTYIVAALSHGLLAWLAESAEVGGATALRSTHGGTKGWILSDCRSTVRSPTLPAAILAAAKRCMGVE